MQEIKGFSKLSKQAKIEWLVNAFFNGDPSVVENLESYWHNDLAIQKLHDEFIENTITNFYVPLGVAPNFKINGKMYCVPMAIEESSVVAAAAKSAGFWKDRGGFKATVIDTCKIGHVHFFWNGSNPQVLYEWFEKNKAVFTEQTKVLTANMEARGGGMKSVKLINKNHLEEGYFQLEARFETVDAMGANFINSCLEQLSKTLETELSGSDLADCDKEVEIVMCILSNYTPECIVKVEVSCPVDELTIGENVEPIDFAEKFIRAIRIANIEPYRATTHNKGIMNGIDSVALATGNDFRAIEACAHAYASRDGQYKSLTNATIDSDNTFRFWIEVPMALGTVGGITKLHPTVKFCHELLGRPGAEELMMIVAATGLAQNFGAVRSLVTTGIQKGHMKMHLLNILNQLEATDQEKEIIRKEFETKTVSHKAVVDAFCSLRGIKSDHKTLKGK